MSKTRNVQAGRQYSLLLLMSGIVLPAGILFMANSGHSQDKTEQSQIVRKAESRYDVIDLGTLGGSTYGRAINAQGQVIGTSSKPGVSSGLIFLWQDAQMQEIGTLAGKTASTAGAINSKGQIVGSADNGGDAWLDPPQAVIYRSGKMDLVFPDARESAAVGINEQEEVVGQMAVKKNVHHAFLWNNGTVTDLGTLQGRNSTATGINAAGHIIGYSDAGRQGLHAFLWKEGKMQDLGTLGGKFSEAMAINDRGQVVGLAETAAGDMRAFLWESGTMRELGNREQAMSSAQAINYRGQAVGHGQPKDGNNESQHALLWEKGQCYDLNDLIPPNSGWELQWANGINDQGQIVGTGKLKGVYRAFQLIPQLNRKHP